MSVNCRSLRIASWNVRGLGRKEKCRDVKRALSSCNVDVAALQETKLPDVSHFKALTFLPQNLVNHSFKPSLGASGGIISAWLDSTLELQSSSVGPFFVHSTFSHLLMDISFCVTNVYGPCDHGSKQCFLDSLKNIADSVHGPWVILGDFNLIRFPHERSNDNFNTQEADWFNDFINDLCLQDIPLLDRLFTWSNNQDLPTLCRLDRALVNLDWSSFFPDTTLSSSTRVTSDHVPIVLHASTSIPKPSVFRFNNHWLGSSAFPPIVVQNWESVLQHDNNAAASICLRLKRVRDAAKKWDKSRKKTKRLGHKL